MFGLSKEEQNRRAYINTVQKLMDEIFLLSSREIADQDRVWDQWVNVQRREWRDLWDLQKENVKDAFKARAMVILLAPKIKWVPFTWHDDTSLDNYLFLGVHDTPPELSLPVRKFVSALLQATVDMTLTPSADEKLQEALVFYNRYLLKILAVLPEDDPDALNLFNRYQINDPVPFWNMDDASGYNPFHRMLSSNIPEKWKKLADEKMREIIRAEQGGRVQARKDWEGALQNYMSHIQSCLYMKSFPYSVDLLASQIGFALGLPNTKGRELICDYHVQTFLTMLQGEKRKELRHQIARHVILADHGEHHAFKIYSPETFAAAKMMLAEFGCDDQELGNRLRDVILQNETRLREESSRTDKHQAQVASVLDQMR